jgi:hypothetical protein
MGWTGKGGTQQPPTVVAIVIVINGGGSMGANNQCPPPHDLDGWPTDNITTIVVSFPPLSIPPCNPFPSSASLFCCRYCIRHRCGHCQASTPHRIPHLRPPSPSHPVLSLSAIMLANSSLDSILKNPSAICKLVEGSLCRCCM